MSGAPRVPTRTTRSAWRSWRSNWRHSAWPTRRLAKQRLREATDAALAAGVFGVPTFEVDGKRIWGQDSLPMLAALLDGDPWFDGPDWEAVRSVPVGVVRA
jgi:hypothetical protein